MIKTLKPSIQALGLDRRMRMRSEQRSESSVVCLVEIRGISELLFGCLA